MRNWHTQRGQSKSDSILKCWWVRPLQNQNRLLHSILSEDGREERGANQGWLAVEQVSRGGGARLFRVCVGGRPGQYKTGLGTRQGALVPFGPSNSTDVLHPSIHLQWARFLKSEATEFYTHEMSSISLMTETTGSAPANKSRVYTIDDILGRRSSNVEPPAKLIGMLLS